MVLTAGVRGSDKSKENLINLMPCDLWDNVLPKLEQLTTYEGKSWTVNWATEARKGLKEEKVKQFEEDELNRMRRLVFKCSEGSKLYQLHFVDTHIGAGGLSSVKALATVLQEKRSSKDQKPRCIDLQMLADYFY